MPTYQEILVDARRRLAAAGCDGVEMESEELLAFAARVTRARLLALRSAAIEAEPRERFEALLARRLAREPLAYLVGETDFHGRRFAVEPGVLIPRVDTECTVAAALEVLRTWRGGKTVDDGPLVAELGVGSGCIIVTLLCEITGARGWGTDISATALKVARVNAERHRVAGRLLLSQGSWFEALDAGLKGRFALIAANPPYIPRGDQRELQPEVRDYEPREALFAGEDGLTAIRAILDEAPDWLAPDGRLVMEIGYGQAEAARGIARETGWVIETIHKDTGGVERALQARRA